MIKFQVEGTKTPHLISFHRDGVSKEDDMELGLDHGLVAQVGVVSPIYIMLVSRFCAARKRSPFA